MVQMLCKLWGFGLFSIAALTTSNILLTMRLMRGRVDSMVDQAMGTGANAGCGGGAANIVPQQPQGSGKWSATLSKQNHSEYIRFLRGVAINTGAADSNSNGVDSNQVVGGDVIAWQGDNSKAQLGQNTFRIDIYKGRTMFEMIPIVSQEIKYSQTSGSLQWDSRRKYKTHDHVFSGPRYSFLTSKQPMCLATQTSVDRLFWLTQQARYWTAPMSVAVFTPDIEYAIARAYLTYLVTCFPFIGEKATFHFTYPQDHLPKDLPIVIDKLETKCDQPLAVLKELLKHRNNKMMAWRERMPYPQNVLRNVARKNCGTEWVLLADVDIVPIPSLAAGLTDFLKSSVATKCKKCAFVIPTYEIDEHSPLPHNRTSLLKLSSKGLARPFHHKVFVHNQHATNFSRWESREQQFPGESTVTVSHPVTNFEFFYEPFYISRDDVPMHDERFLGYGFTRNTQVYEMFVGGYSFQVLAPIFSLHWGMQVKRNRPAWREKQNNANRRLFEGFKREVFARYGKDPLNMMAPKKSQKKS